MPRFACVCVCELYPCAVSPMVTQCCVCVCRCMCECVLTAGRAGPGRLGSSSPLGEWTGVNGPCVSCVYEQGRIVHRARRARAPPEIGRALGPVGPEPESGLGHAGPGESQPECEQARPGPMQQCDFD